MKEKQNPNTIESFNSFELHPKIIQGITEAGFTQPSQIQIKAIPAVLTGQDVIAQAQTGTGKTAAFGLPTMSRIADMQSTKVEMLVITPTRELAAQVSDEMFRLGKFADIRTVAVYGGQSIQRQVDFINRGCQVVVATPGRLLDHLKSGRLRNFTPSIVVLDEADEMLDMGFLDDINEIFTFLPKQRQTLLFSATLPQPIKRLADTILKDPVSINVIANQTTNKDIEQFYYVIEEQERKDALIRLIDSEGVEKGIVFCRTIKETDELSSILAARSYSVRAMHGDMEQSKRQEAIRQMQVGKIDILIATDVAARGLDISDVSHVFNYHMPFNSDSYVHRIGRTGRAGKKGKAITLVTPGEFRKLRGIEQQTKIPLINRAIPSIADVRRSLYPKLTQTIIDQPIREEAIQILSMLDDAIDVSQVASKLISIMLDQRPIAGPNEIGLKGERLDILLRGGRISNRRDEGGQGRGRFGGGKPSFGPRAGGNSRFGGERGKSSGQFNDKPREGSRGNNFGFKDGNRNQFGPKDSRGGGLGAKGTSGGNFSIKKGPKSHV